MREPLWLFTIFSTAVGNETCVERNPASEPEPSSSIIPLLKSSGTFVLCIPLLERKTALYCANLRVICIPICYLSATSTIASLMFIFMSHYYNANLRRIAGDSLLFPHYPDQLFSA